MKGIFVTVFTILFLFNVLYVTTTPESDVDIYTGAITGLIASAIAVGVLGGIQILGTGLNTASIKILFGTSTLLNILFSINVAGFPVGLGLASNILTVFPASEGFGVGFMIVTCLTAVALVSGLTIIIGGGD